MSYDFDTDENEKIEEIVGQQFLAQPQITLITTGIFVSYFITSIFILYSFLLILIFVNNFYLIIFFLITFFFLCYETICSWVGFDSSTLATFCFILNMLIVVFFCICFYLLFTGFSTTLYFATVQNKYLFGTALPEIFLSLLLIFFIYWRQEFFNMFNHYVIVFPLYNETTKILDATNAYKILMPMFSFITKNYNTRWFKIIWFTLYIICIIIYPCLNLGFFYLFFFFQFNLFNWLYLAPLSLLAYIFRHFHYNFLLFVDYNLRELKSKLIIKNTNPILLVGKGILLDPNRVDVELTQKGTEENFTKEDLPILTNYWFLLITIMETYYNTRHLFKFLNLFILIFKFSLLVYITYVSFSFDDTSIKLMLCVIGIKKTQLFQKSPKIFETHIPGAKREMGTLVFSVKWEAEGYLRKQTNNAFSPVHNIIPGKSQVPGKNTQINSESDEVQQGFIPSFLVNKIVSALIFFVLLLIVFFYCLCIYLLITGSPPAIYLEDLQKLEISFKLTIIGLLSTFMLQFNVQFIGPVATLIMQKLCKKLYYSQGLRNFWIVQRTFCIIIYPIMSLLFLYSFIFLHFDLYSWLFFVPMSFLAWVFKHLTYQVLGYIALTLKNLDQFCEIRFDEQKVFFVDENAEKSYIIVRLNERGIANGLREDDIKHYFFLLMSVYVNNEQNLEIFRAIGFSLFLLRIFYILYLVAALFFFN